MTEYRHKISNPVIVKPGHYCRLICCDCGLAHAVFVARGKRGTVLLDYQRDEGYTILLRKLEGTKVRPGKLDWSPETGKLRKRK